jgi:hypothetical protein
LNANLDISGAVADALSVLRKRWPAFLILGAALVMLPQFVTLGVRYVGRGANLGPAAVALGLLVFLLSLVYLGGLFHATTRALEGEPCTLEDMFRAGLRFWGPMIGLTVLVQISVDLGLVLLIVPGVLILLRWSMAGPAMVAENLGVFAALRRSAELTKNHRWPIFLAYLSFLLIIFVVELGFVAAAGGRSAIRAMTTMEVVTPFTLVMMGVVHPGFGLIMSIGFEVFIASLFHRLRGGRRAGTTEAIAEVFA